MSKFTNMISLFLALIFFLILAYLLVGKAPQHQKIVWGVNFSQMQAESLKLNWKTAYKKILQDLGAKNIKLLTQWDWVEGERGNYFFNDIDWQIQQAEFHGANIIYVLGMKTGRWPECHLPDWAENLSKKEQQKAILLYITQVINRYKNSQAIVAWQVENEPLFPFGECPWYDGEFLKKEIALVKSLDPNRPIVITDSGEQSLWWKAAEIGDIVGVTMYRKAWFNITDRIGFYFTFPLPPLTYWRKAQIVQKIFKKQVFCAELQAEPWAFKTFYDVPLDEQYKTMNLKRFRKNISYAKNTGLNIFYLWGVEWWIWLDEKHQKPEIWNEAKNLIKESELHNFPAMFQELSK